MQGLRDKVPADMTFTLWSPLLFFVPVGITAPGMGLVANEASSTKSAMMQVPGIATMTVFFESISMVVIRDFLTASAGSLYAPDAPLRASENVGLSQPHAACSMLFVNQPGRPFGLAVPRAVLPTAAAANWLKSLADADGSTCVCPSAANDPNRGSPITSWGQDAAAAADLWLAFIAYLAAGCDAPMGC